MKPKYIGVITAATLAVAGTFGVAAQSHAATTAPAAYSQSVAGAASVSYSSLPPFAGHTYLISTDAGNVYKNTYSADGTSLHSVTVGGPGTGDSFDAPISVAQVGRGLYFVSWVEPSTLTVSHVMNFNTCSISLFITYGTATGGRAGELHSATFSQVS